MQAWGTSLLIAVLVATVPFTCSSMFCFSCRAALAQSHRRWPLPLNYGLVAAVTSYTTYFIHRGYVGSHVLDGNCRRVPDSGSSLWICPGPAAAAILRGLSGIHRYRRARRIWAAQDHAIEISRMSKRLRSVATRPNCASRPCTDACSRSLFPGGMFRFSSIRFKKASRWIVYETRHSAI